MALVHEFYRQHVALWCLTGVDAIVIGDDWGSQSVLLISPRQWRRLFRPLYADYFAQAHSAGKRVFFHSDGMIREIIPDLIDIGVEALNSQLFCMDIEEIGRTFRGQLTFWGEIDFIDDIEMTIREETGTHGEILKHTTIRTPTGEMTDTFVTPPDRPAYWANHLVKSEADLPALIYLIERTAQVSLDESPDPLPQREPSTLRRGRSGTGFHRGGLPEPGVGGGPVPPR